MISTVKTVALFSMLCLCGACTQEKAEGQTAAYDEDKFEKLGITNKDYLSAASKRALDWPELSNNWYGDFRVRDLKGDFAYEEGVVRRDPSSILYEDGLYHAWYTKSEGPSSGFTAGLGSKVWPWDHAEVWHATSKDGVTWKERSLAVPRGEPGTFDDRSVFTPEVSKHEGTYYLVYQVVKSPYIQRVQNQVGISYSDSPWGPWTKHPEPILSPADNGVWKGDDVHDRSNVERKGDFDSHKVHDPYLTFFNGKFHLYYKGEQMGEEVTFGGREIRHGVATSDSPFGPYEKSLYNPISNSGHEVAVWHFDGGIGSLITTDGPERNTIQWAQDGINFEILAHLKDAPHAMGLLRKNDNSEIPFKIFEWGLTHEYKTKDYQYIRRFDGHQRPRVFSSSTHERL